ncbi:hypothetical protein [Methylobacterium planeticum]|uniref:Uncharacterized protein n=1 Tax=Methylobacterium planeticum TaxID=2615211 RepID=A0A6N6MJL5_9HYPH|nr:hypothetical protein [Methylobacterium planeticum]KAB1069274.1 hypothetical protein F6X51_25715 [Methylobacterium planeticum]
MIRKLIPSLRAAKAEGDIPHPDGAAEMRLRDVVGEFPPMHPLLPPAPENDDLSQATYELVEHDLRAAGFLR